MKVRKLKIAFQKLDAVGKFTTQDLLNKYGNKIYTHSEADDWCEITDIEYKDVNFFEEDNIKEISNKYTKKLNIIFNLYYVK